MVENMTNLTIQCINISFVIGAREYPSIQKGRKETQAINIKEACNCH